MFDYTGFLYLKSWVEIEVTIALEIKQTRESLWVGWKSICLSC